MTHTAFGKSRLKSLPASLAQRNRKGWLHVLLPTSEEGMQLSVADQFLDGQNISILTL